MADVPMDIDDLDFLRNEHNEEMEVLFSIYDGDPNFKIINGSTIQYKIGENEEPLSILVEIQWSADYPESIPSVNLESFYNQHLPSRAKKEAMKGILDEAWRNVGDQQTYAIIEWMKEHMLQVIGPYVFDEVCRLESRENENPSDAPKKDMEEEASKKESKKEQMTKAQKRREWDKMDKEGKVARGHDWVDVVRHLSQTGGNAEGGAASGSGETSKMPQ